MQDFLSTICAFALLAGVVSIVVLLVLKARRMAGVSALCSLALAICFPLLADATARSKGFVDRYDMQAAFDANVPNPAAWGKVRGNADAAPASPMKTASETSVRID